MKPSFAAPAVDDLQGVEPQGVDPQGVDPHWVELDAVVTRAEQLRAELARLHAERARVCADALDLVADRVAQRAAARVAHRGAIGDDMPLREVVAELGAAMRVGDRTVHGWLNDGAALVHRYPATLAALDAGVIDERHASAIIDGGDTIDDDGVRRVYEAQVLRAAETETAVSLRAIARVIAARLQPEQVDERHRRAHERRRVRLYDIEDGLTRLIADLPAALGRAAYERLSDLARDAGGEAGSAGAAASASDADADAPDPDALDPDADARTLDERRADVLCDLLLGARPAVHGASGGDGLGDIRATVQVTIPVLTLAGVGDQPAILDTHGPIDAETARRLAAAAPAWERIFVHAHTGEPVACDSYRPSAELRRLLTARDQHCRWLGCRRTARRCDADHTVAHSEGGATAASNLALLCRRHHRLKHASPWTVRHLGRGSLEFTSPTGRAYRNDAPPIVEFTAHDRSFDGVHPTYDAADPAPF